MALNDILLQLASYPDASTPADVDWAVDFAAGVGGKLSALAVNVKLPVHSNVAADYLVGLSSLAREEEAKSLQACEDLLGHFAARATGANVLSDQIVDPARLEEVADHVARHARTRDLCIVPGGVNSASQRGVAEAAIFGSGRPVLVFQPSSARVWQGAPRRVVVAWDGSRSAARALADAQPILSLAQEVRVLTILNEKPTATAGLGAEPLRHLLAHGVKAVLDEVDADGAPIGEALGAYLTAKSPDLLVMGAFGHSRFREFVLGGATRSMLAAPPVPLLLSH